MIGPNSRGIWCQTADVNVVRSCAGLGFDWLALDAQHGDIDRRAVLELGRALGDAGTNFAIRIPELDFAWIGAALDAGASTVIVPQIDTVEQAAAAVAAAFYPPIGTRSWGPFPALWGGSVPAPEQANQAVRCAVMIESAQALTNVDEIAAVPGLGMLFVGPFDLSLSLGSNADTVIGSDAGPLQRIVQAGAAHEVAVGAFAGDPVRARGLRRAGISCLAVATDLGLLQAGAAAVLDAD
ncbi:MAG TPA: aldolase/citrate lyase family protein [Propionibacteriaceae bacterium]